MLITLDVEDHGSATEAPRFDDALQPLLDELAARKLTATFFVVGELAPSWKDALIALDQAGHEIGLHGYTHTFLKKLGPEGFRDELAQGRDTLGSILGRAPLGFRAPYFSLTKETPWAPEILVQSGFRYSSSVLPAWNPQAGYPGAPRSAFKWPCGLIEFPVPVFGVKQLALPVLGGAYLRLLPQLVVKLAARRAEKRNGQWTYAHPYDFDVEEEFYRRPGQSWIIAKLLFARRQLMIKRVAELANSGAPTLGSYASDQEFVSSLPIFEPPAEQR